MIRLRKFFYNTLKIIFFIALIPTIFWGMVVFSTYLSRWTTEQPKEKIYSLCYVAVDNPKQFVQYKELTDEPIYLLNELTKENNVNGWQSWKLTTEDQTKLVYFIDPDYSSWFKYLIVDGKIHPISCRIMGPASGISGGFLTVLLFIIFYSSRHFYRWRKLRKNINNAVD